MDLKLYELRGIAVMQNHGTRKKGIDSSTQTGSLQFVCDGYDVVRIILGLVLLAAAALKGHQLATEPLLEIGLFTSRWFLIGLIEFELFFGFWLLSGLFPRRTWMFSLACFTVLGGISLFRGLAGDSSCGCFGRVEVNPWWTLLLDVMIVAALYRFRPVRSATADVSPTAANMNSFALRLTVLVLATLLMGIPIAMIRQDPASLSADGLIMGRGEIVILEPEKWIGKRFPLFPHIDIGDQLIQGQWTILLYHHDCPKCQEVITRYERLQHEYASTANHRRIAVIEMPPYADGSVSPTDSHLGFSMGKLSDRKQWFVAAPVEIILEQGTVSIVSTEAD